MPGRITSLLMIVFLMLAVPLFAQEPEEVSAPAGEFEGVVLGSSFGEAQNQIEKRFGEAKIKGDTITATVYMQGAGVPVKFVCGGEGRTLSEVVFLYPLLSFPEVKGKYVEKFGAPAEDRGNHSALWSWPENGFEVQVKNLDPFQLGDLGKGEEPAMKSKMEPEYSSRRDSSFSLTANVSALTKGKDSKTSHAEVRYVISKLEDD